MNKRIWLNPKTSYDTGALHVYVTRHSDSSYIDAELSLWDCSRKIHLSFGCNGYTLKETQERANKIDLIINALQEMKVAMGKAYNDILSEEDAIASGLVLLDDLDEGLDYE